MCFIICLIGNHKVGKSTIFNKLTNTKNAIISNKKYFTTDRKYGICNFKKFKFKIIDTPPFNFFYNNSILSKKLKFQIKIAISESNIILFIVDNKKGLTYNDIFLSDYLKKKNKKIILIINKFENNLINNLKLIDFYNLNYKNIIKFSNNISINNLINKIIKNKNKNKIKNKKFIKVIILGKTNVGKSTLLNKIINKNRLLIYDLNNTTKNYIEIEYIYNKNNYLFLDTIGFNKKINNIYFKKNIKIIKKSNLILFLIDSKNKITNFEFKILKYIYKLRKSLLILINKCDLINKNEKKNYKRNIKKKLKFLYYTKFKFISAKNNLGINNIIKKIYNIYISSIFKFNTYNLNKNLIKLNKISLLKKNIKLKFAHQGSIKPLKIIIHSKILNKNNKKKCILYIEKYFYKIYSLFCTPINIIINN
ncbi:putative GTP-binding protein engA [Candidatus Zinderia insecticola CARI]|uniref:GTPase Der n=1 Tax=Zinderia insecticola (strain CARI) TaxID=871271 RepID=E0TIV9_ZINIC|nr:putative GTP-binding protein engA [Candidatus Zinderia insecticola CARI]